MYRSKNKSSHVIINSDGKPDLPEKKSVPLFRSQYWEMRNINKSYYI